MVTRFVPQAGFFRSSIAGALGGLFAGGSVMVAAAGAAPWESALATLLTALAVLVGDHLARTRRERRHETKFEQEHAETQRLVKQLLNRKGVK